MAHAPAVWLTAIVGLSALVRGSIGLRVPAPWILPDEIVYSELAKSIAAGHRPAVRGVPVFGWGEVYPTLIAPAWVLIDDPLHAYHAALAISALVMSLAAVPAYFLARLFVSRTASLVVAALTVLVPSMSYAGVVMTENAFYPVFLLSVLLIARTLQRPSVGRQAAAVAGLVLVAFTRMQGLALVGAYLAAVVIYSSTGPPAARRAYLRRFVPTAALLLAAILVPLLVSVALGAGPFGWLGARSGTFADFHAGEVPKWFTYLTSDMILYVAVIPVLATVMVVAGGVRGRAPERARLFAAVTSATVAALLVSVALVSASMSVDGTKNLNERYVFYLVPLLFIGLALWSREGLPRARPWALLTVVACCMLTVVLPVGQLRYNAGFQSVGLLPWIGLSHHSGVRAALMGVFVLACGALWLVCRRDGVGRLWVVVGVWIAMVGALTVGSNAVTAADSARAIRGVSATWVDDTVPAPSKVAVLWDENLAKADRPDPFYFWVMVTEFFNVRVGPVYRLGPPTYYDGFLPTVGARRRADGVIVDGRGTALRADYVLATCRTPLEGRLVASAPRGALRLVAVDGRIRSSGRPPCTRRQP